MDDTLATITGTLVHGMKVGDQVHKDFELREAIAEDYFSAEGDATADTPMSFRGALLARQLVRVGTFTGPFSFRQIAKLRGRDLSALMDKQRELDVMGEGEQLGAKNG